MLFLQDSKSHENVLSSLMMTLIASDDLKDDVFSVDTTNVFLWLFFYCFSMIRPLAVSFMPMLKNIPTV